MKVIGYISENNPFEDRVAWSGLIYKLRESIQQAGFNVIWIPFKTDTKWLKLSNKIRWELHKFTGKKQILGGVHNPIDTFLYAKTIDATIIEKCDYLFFPRGGQIGTFLKTKVPIIYHADATAFVMNDYYWNNVSSISKIITLYLEKKATQHAIINIRASQWAADSVINDCHCSIEKCKVLEFGPNIDTTLIRACSPYQGGRLKMLFSGVDWKRKGGDVAIETTRLLREKGIDAILTIVGIRDIPSQYADIDYINNVGFLNKNEGNNQQKYAELYHNNHLFILPTIAECAGVVFSEASAFGLPSYTYNTGGTSNYVIDGQNGRSFSLKCGAEEFAEAIYEDLMSGRLMSYHESALKLYHDKLSWEAWSRRFRELFTD